MAVALLTVIGKSMKLLADVPWNKGKRGRRGLAKDQSDFFRRSLPNSPGEACTVRPKTSDMAKYVRSTSSFT